MGIPLQFGSSSHSVCTCLLKVSQFNKRRSNKQEFDTRLSKTNDNSNNCPIVSVCSIIRLRHSVCVCVLKLLQCVFRVSYLHSHALCSVKLMNTSFCCFRRFNLFICGTKGQKKSLGWLAEASETWQTCALLLGYISCLTYFVLSTVVLRETVWSDKLPLLWSGLTDK